MIAELLWTAPELLRGTGGSRKASFKGDVFSLGIILQEVLTRGPPYCSWGLSAEGMCPPLSGHPAPQTDPAIVLPPHPTVQFQRTVLQIFGVSQPERWGRGTAELLMDGLLIHRGLTFAFFHQSPAQWTLPISGLGLESQGGAR